MVIARALGRVIDAGPDRQPRRDRGPDRRHRAAARARDASRCTRRSTRTRRTSTRADVAVEIGSYLDAEAVVEAARARGRARGAPGLRLPERERGVRPRGAWTPAWPGSGRPPEAIELMGDKARAKALAREAGVPVVPGVEGEDVSLEEVRAFAAEHGYPVVIKAVAGGGGKGMRVVRGAAELEAALEAARREAQGRVRRRRACSSSATSSARATSRSRCSPTRTASVVHLGERECSLQRRHQKVIEEAPSPAVDDALRARMGEAAVALARACGYAGAGTVEFIAPADASAFFFLEMNTRLQVEHPVTELVYGVDLVEQQLRVAAGEPLALDPGGARPRGHAVEARLYAEDPANGFLPAVGTVRRYVEPGGRADGLRDPRGQRGRHGLRPDAREGDRPRGRPPGGAAAAGARARRAASCSASTTNAAFSRALLEREDVRAGEIDTGLLERILAEPPPAPPEDLVPGRRARRRRHPRPRRARSGCAWRSTASCGSRTARVRGGRREWRADVRGRRRRGACAWRSTALARTLRVRARRRRALDRPRRAPPRGCASRAPRAARPTARTRWRRRCPARCCSSTRRTARRSRRGRCSS